MNRKRPFSIIITDLNHNIRDLLHRELADERFTVHCISTGPEVYNQIMKPDSVDVVILDPEMLQPYGRHLLEDILAQHGGPLIILHTYQKVDEKSRSNPKLLYIEKGKYSVDTIVEKVRQLRNLQPEH